MQQSHYKAFYDLLKSFKGRLRKSFDSPLIDLVESNKSLAAKIFISYLELHRPEKAKVEKMKHQKLLKGIEYSPFPYLSLDGDISNTLNRMVCEMPQDELIQIIPSILPKAFEAEYIDESGLKNFIEKLELRILYPASRIICLIEQEGLLRAGFDALKQIAANSGSIRIELLKKSFSRIHYLDLKHIQTLQFQGGKVTGFHDYPENGHAVFDSEDNRTTIHAHIAFPRFFTPHTLTAPVRGKVVSDNGGGLEHTKMSTFPLKKRTAQEIVQEIEAVLLNPVNVPLAKALGGSLEYYGRDPDGAMRLVLTNDDQGINRIGTSFHIPFAEERNLNPMLENRPFRDATIVHEQGAAHVMANPPISPQKKLATYIKSQVQHPVKKSKAENRTVSNQELGPFIQTIKNSLSNPNSPFSNIPTPDGGTVLIQTTMKDCGLPLERYLSDGYRPSKSPDSVKKRIPSDKIGKVFEEPALLLQYPNWETLARLILEINESKIE